MIRNVLTEARLALLISTLALLATFWQAFEARRNNALQEDDPRIEATLVPSIKVACNKVPVLGWNTEWEISVFNNSVQPLVITKIQAEFVKLAYPNILGYERKITKSALPGGMPDGVKLPFSIASKTYGKFRVKVNFLYVEGFGRYDPGLELCGTQDGKSAAPSFWPAAQDRKRMTPPSKSSWDQSLLDQLSGGSREDERSDWGWKIGEIEDGHIGIMIDLHTAPNSRFKQFVPILTPYLSWSEGRNPEQP